MYSLYQKCTMSEILNISELDDLFFKIFEGEKEALVALFCIIKIKLLQLSKVNFDNSIESIYYEITETLELENIDENIRIALLDEFQTIMSQIIILEKDERYVKHFVQSDLGALFEKFVNCVDRINRLKSNFKEVFKAEFSSINSCSKEDLSLVENNEITRIKETEDITLHHKLLSNDVETFFNGVSMLFAELIATFHENKELRKGFYSRVDPEDEKRCTLHFYTHLYTASSVSRKNGFKIDLEAYVGKYRCDIQLSNTYHTIRVEAKCNSHTKLWTAVENQLISKYITPDCPYGVYLVFWFDENILTSKPRNFPPATVNTAQDLEEVLHKYSTPKGMQNNVKVFCVDCTVKRQV